MSGCDSVLKCVERSVCPDGTLSLSVSCRRPPGDYENKRAQDPRRALSRVLRNYNTMEPASTTTDRRCIVPVLDMKSRESNTPDAV